VQRVQSDGAGEVASASEQAIAQWFSSKGAEYTETIHKLCIAQRRPESTASDDRTEARICAAANAAQFEKGWPAAKP